MPKMSYDSIKKQLSKLKAQAAKMEAAESVAKKRSVAKVTALITHFGDRDRRVRDRERGSHLRRVARI